MSVELDPPELGFRRPFTQEVTQILRLKNLNSDPVAFKVKTTAPKQYCVRPNSGRIEPGNTVEIQVLLQAMKEDPPLDARCRDKFLVQSVAILPDQELPNVAAIWQNIEKTAKGSIQERKIRVTFLPAHGTSTPSHSTPGLMVNGVSPSAADHDAPPPAYRSPSPTTVYGSPEPTSSQALQQQQQAPHFGDSSAPTAVESVEESVSTAVGATQESLQQQLDAARETIRALQKQAEEALQQRKMAGEGGPSGGGAQALGTQMAQQGVEGVPVQITAALCLLSFLLAYFFF